MSVLPINLLTIWSVLALVIAAARANERLKYGYLAIVAMELGAENVEGLDSEAKDLVQRKKDKVTSDKSQVALVHSR